MGLSRRRQAGAHAGLPSLPSGPRPRPEPVWLAGSVEVQIVGETFHLAQITAATRNAPDGSRLPAVLVTEPGNPHDPNAVGVHVNGFQVGHLPRQIAPAVQAALSAFTAANGGRPPSCPAQVIWHDKKPQVILFLDPAPLGLPASLFDWIPELAQVIRRTLPMLDSPAPVLTGCDLPARQQLSAAEALRAQADADYSRSPGSWPRAEHAFLAVTRLLEEAGDPQVADAWVGVARSVRYQKGRRDDRITAAVTALYWNRTCTQAWLELIDIASAAPHVPTLLDVFRRVPASTRPPVLTKLISLSRGTDRFGNMRPEAGQRLRAQLAATAEADGDKPSITKLTRDARKHATDR